MKILISGATGFVGSNLINGLLGEGGYDIVATSRHLEKAKKFDWFDRVTYIPYDLSIDANNINLNSYFGNPDKFIHLAWEDLTDYNSPSHIEIYLFQHYNFIKNFIKNGLREVVITGTCFEYGLKNGALSERMPVSPINAYAISKDTLHKFISELKNQYDFNYKWIRLFYIYGSGQSEHTLMSLLDRAIDSESKEFNMSGGEQLRDYLHIDDVVSNLILLTKQNECINQSINCCSGVPISIRKLVENHLLSKKCKLKLNLGFYPYPKHEPMAFWGDDKILKRLVNL
jgi:nucleoside-diphosphate-sugar epimerase